MKLARCSALAGLLLLLAACAPAPTPQIPPAREVAPLLPEAFYRDAGAHGLRVFAIDAGRSSVLIRVYRAGPLARFGHDHVVASRAVHGYALWPVDFAGARADLYVPVESLTVDEPDLRIREGLAAGPGAADIEATRRHMLDSVLEAQRYPYVLIHATCASADCGAVDALVTLHGVTRKVQVPVSVQSSSEGQTVSGSLHLHLTDFHMTPYTALGGAIQVADGVDLSFRLAARHIDLAD